MVSRFLSSVLRHCPVLLLAFSLPAGYAQTASFNGALKTLLSPNSQYSIAGAAVDAAGNVFFVDLHQGLLVEMVAVNGSIPAQNPTIQTLASGFNQPGGVALDGADNLYVADTGNRVVKEIPAAGGYTSVVTLAGLPAPSSVAVDKSGDLFVADEVLDAVFEIQAVGGAIPPSPTVTLVVGGFSFPTGLAVDASGNLFVADAGNNAIDEIRAVGGSIPPSPAITPLAGGFVFPYGVAVDGSGNVFVADTGNGAAKEILASGGYSIVNPLGSTFDHPQAVAVASSGDVFIGDAGDGALTEIALAGGNFGRVNVASASPSSVAISFIFNSSATLGSTAVLTQGAPSLDFTDAGNNTCTPGLYIAGQTCLVNVKLTPTYPGPRLGAVELLDSSGRLLAVGYVQATGVGPQIAFANTTAGAYAPSAQAALGSRFNQALGVAVDGVGNVFVADTADGAVKEIPAAGGYAAVNSLASGFIQPTGVAVDGAGNLFVSDPGINGIWEILAAGGYTTVNILPVAFTSPEGLAVDGAGNLFVVDSVKNAVYEVPPAGGYSGANILNSGFNRPYAVAVDGSGNLFVADYGSNAVKQVLAAGGYSAVNTLASGFSHPQGVAVDGAGNVLVADTGNGAVKRILAVGGYIVVDILGGAFQQPAGIAVDARGNVLVTDSALTTVSWLDYADAPSLAFASTPVGSTSSDSPQTVTVSNDGNAPLIFPTPSISTNPGIASPSFMLGGNATCPVVSAYITPQSLAAGFHCTLPVSFTPTAVGSESGELAFTDNTLDAEAPSYAAQAISLVGEGLKVSTTTTLSSTANPSTWAGPVIFLAHVAAVSGPAEATGSVQFSINGAAAGPLLPLVDGAATYTTASLAPGATYPVQAAYLPTADSLFLPSSATLSQVVNLGTATVTLASSANPVFVQNPVTLVASVTGLTVPTGAVTFFDGAIPIGSGPVTSGGVSLFLSNLAASSHSLTAAYSGDANFAAATSNVVTENVDDFTLSAGTAAATPTAVNTGAKATYTITVSPVAPATNFPAAIALTADGGPSGATYSFSPSPVPLGAASTAVTLTIDIPTTVVASFDPPIHGTTLAGGATHRRHGQSPSRLPFLALLLLPLTGRLRRAGRRLGRMTALLLLLAAGIAAGASLSSCASPPLLIPYTVNITATSGALTHTTTVPLTVQ
jgi:sugar lactone lactonase YvrE